MLDIIEIRGRSPQGATKPFICRAEDERIYYVKGNSALGDGRIAEYVSAELALLFGLPIPEFAIVNIPSELIEFDEELQFALGAGPAFASLQIEQPQEVNFSSLSNMNAELLKDIFIFDYWINNADRTGTANGGNSNLIYQPNSSELFIIDHNLAFDVSFEFDTFKELHICSQAWYANQCDLFTKQNYQAKLETGLQQFKSICEKIPEQWFDCATIDDNFLQRLETTLKGFQQDIFWENLK